MKTLLLLIIFISCEKPTDKTDKTPSASNDYSDYRLNQTEPRVQFVDGGTYILNGDEYTLKIEDDYGSYMQVISLNRPEKTYTIKSNQKLRVDVKKEALVTISRYNENGYYRGGSSYANEIFANDSQIEMCYEECLVFRR